MQTVVFVPGIFGTEMLRAGDGFKLWPPLTERETLSTDERAKQLIDPSTTPGDLLEGIPLLPFVDLPEYSPVTEFLESFPGTTLLRFPYDWRADVRDTARVLSARLAEVDGPIVIVTHSMGGLVGRFLLESGEFDHESWFPQVTQLVCIAVPHHGAPLSVFRILGREGLSGFLFPASALSIMASRPDMYPAGHQLLPPATIGCVQMGNGLTASAATAFPAIARVGVAAAEALHAVLDRFHRPPNVLYRLIYGFGHPETTVGVSLDAQGNPAHVGGDGDGTVPLWSARPTRLESQLDDRFGVVGDHIGMLKDRGLLQKLEDWISPRIA